MTGNSFGLQEEPFRLTPDPRYLFPTRSVVQALGGLVTGIAQRKGLLQITGESGTGKTAVLHKLAQDLEASNSFVFSWTHSHLLFDDLIMACAEKAGLRLRATSREARVSSLTDKVTQSLTGAATAVIVIDEAEKCGDDVLEGIQALARIDHGMSWAWQIVLAGAPGFETRLQDERWQSLHEEIGVRVALERLRGPEMRAYIAHRLHVAGLARGALFTPEALSRIETYAAGIPRLVNRLCSRAMAEAASMGAWSVTADMVDVAAHEFSIVQAPLSAPGAASRPELRAPDASAAPPPQVIQPPPAPPPAAGAALLGSMFRQFAEESRYQTELSAAAPAPEAANEQADDSHKVEAPVAAEVAAAAEPAAPIEPVADEPAAPVVAAVDRDLPAVEAVAVETPAIAEAPVAPDMPAPAAEEVRAPEPAQAAHTDDPGVDMPAPPAAQEPARVDEPAVAAAPDAGAEKMPEEPAAAAAAASAPDSEKATLKAAIAATIAASAAHPTLAAPTEDDRVVPANDHEPAEPGRLAGQVIKIAAAVVIGLAVGALGAYVIQLRPTGSDQIAAVRTTPQDTGPLAAAEAPPPPPANVAAAPAPVAPTPTGHPLNGITPSAGSIVPPPLPAPESPAAVTPAPAAAPTSVASAPPQPDTKPEPPKASETPAVTEAAVAPPPPPKPPLEAQPVPPPVVSAPPPAPPVVATIPPPPPPKPAAEAMPAPPPAPPVAAAPPPPKPTADSAPVTPPAPLVAAAPPPKLAVDTAPVAPPAPARPAAHIPSPPPVVEIPEPTPQTPIVEAIPEAPPVAAAEPAPAARTLLPILPQAAGPAPSASATSTAPSSSGRALAPILPAPVPAPPVSAEKAPTPSPTASVRTLIPILPPPVGPQAAPPATVATPAPPADTPPKLAEVPPPVATPNPEPPAPQIAKAEPKVEPIPPAPSSAAAPAALARVEPPPAAPAPVVAPAPVPLQRPTASLSSVAVDRLILRGDEVMRTGDPAAARLYYELAAANGSAAAATAVGRTWDPAEHARLGIQGSLASAPRAAEWYRKASAAGDPNADARLRALTAWMTRNPVR